MTSRDCYFAFFCATQRVISFLSETQAVISFLN